MACNASNHSASCSCGFGGDTGGRLEGSSHLLNVVHRASVRFESCSSFVNPNASCPVCGSPVFFYQSSFGGRVFFDELGPPWPKHPCTVKSPEILEKFNSWPVKDQAKSVMKVSYQPSPEDREWRPIVITRVYAEDDWWVLRVNYVDNHIMMRLLISDRFDLWQGSVAYFRGWDGSGYGTISFLNNAGTVEVVEAPVFKYSEYALLSQQDVVSKRIHMEITGL